MPAKDYEAILVDKDGKEHKVRTSIANFDGDEAAAKATWERLNKDSGMKIKSMTFVGDVSPERQESIEAFMQPPTNAINQVNPITGGLPKP